MKILKISLSVLFVIISISANIYLGVFVIPRYSRHIVKLKKEVIFKQILGGSSAIVNGLGQMRNKLGDSHGTNGLSAKPKERHSELAVNLAGTMSIFLYKTYKEKYE